MTDTKPGYKSTEVYISGTIGVALAAALTAALDSGQEIAAAGCAVALSLTGCAYALARSRAKGGAA